VRSAPTWYGSDAVVCGDDTGQMAVVRIARPDRPVRFDHQHHGRRVESVVEDDDELRRPVSFEVRARPCPRDERASDQIPGTEHRSQAV